MVYFNKISSKLLILSVSCLFFLGSCKKETNLMEDPDSRLIATLEEYKQVLVGADHGWIATIYPGAGGGYSFYFSFSEDDRVAMLGDFNQETGSVLRESSYRMKALQRPTLIFDTYNYLHMLHDPDRNVSGGERGEGLLSDFEFAMVQVSPEEIHLEGTFNKNKMTLRPATAAQREAIIGGAWADMQQTAANYITANPFLYLQFADNVRVAVEINVTSKKVMISWLEGANASASQTENFSFVENGLRLENPLEYKGQTIHGFSFDGASNAFIAQVDASVVPVQRSSNPIMPMHTLFGHGNEWTVLHIEGEELPAGVNSEFNAVYNETVALFRASGREILYTDLTFTDAEQITLRVRYRSISAGTEFVATSTFDYERNGDMLSLKLVANNNNWNTRRSQLVRMNEYFDDPQFRIDWVENPNPTEGFVGGLYRSDNSFFYGFLR